MSELFPTQPRVIEPLSTIEQRNVEIWLVYHFLRQERRLSAPYVKEIIDNAFHLTPSSNHMYVILGKQEQDLINRFDQTQGSLVFQLIMKNHYEKYLPKS
ncbi:MAG: hypothetical protein AAFY41_00770 [Bacteroidota bacterium]